MASRPAQPHRLVVVEVRCSGEQLVGEGNLLIGQAVQILRPALPDGTIRRADLGEHNFEIDGHDYPPAIMRISGSDDDSGLLQAVEGGRDRTPCSKSGSVREFAGRRRTEKHQQAGQLKIRAVQTGPLGHGVLEQHGTGHEHLHRVADVLDQGIALRTC